MAPGLAALLILMIAGVLLSPYWAPALMPLLPWGQRPAVDQYAALAARVTALEERPVAPPADLGPIKSTQGALTQRITDLEHAVAALRQSEPADTTAALAQQAQRLDALAAQSTAEVGGLRADIDKLRRDLAERETTAADLAKRLDGLEQQARAWNNIDRGGAVQLLALLEMYQAVEAARPFAAEYATFSELAARDPKLAAAAAPLAAAARQGVASPAVLRQRLSELADQIATAKPEAAKPKWWARALDQLRGLVTIRRIDATVKTGPWAAIDAARSDLAQGDLASAVGALEKLTGANAEAAEPWLRMARGRLAVEQALTRLQELLTAQLGRPSGVAPATAPAPAPAVKPPS